MVPTANNSDLSSLQTCARILADRTPNLLRLFLNPWVAQTCVCLNHYAQSLAFLPNLNAEDCPSFLANSKEEALSGAIKLARFTVNSRKLPDRSSTVIIVDPYERFPHFGTSRRTDNSCVEFLPGIVRCCEQNLSEVLNQHANASIVVLADGAQRIADHESLRVLWLNPDVVTIRCIDTNRTPDSCSERLAPRADILVFDESFVDHEVAFAAFTARTSLFALWMSGKMSMFHSTTFQPNSLTTRHFMDCISGRDPAMAHILHDELQKIEHDRQAQLDVYRRLYSPSLAKLIATTGFHRGEVQAAGHFISVTNAPQKTDPPRASAIRQIFDGVAGVACSLRGHNPPDFVDEVRSTLENSDDLYRSVADLLDQLTGLAHHVPAVSGASAVEHALQIALTIQPERPHVLALQGGFGGKTLGALTGTSRPRYKQNLGPLYQHVTYINPFARTAVEDIHKVLQQHPVGVVQTELIQGVGGVREIPPLVLDALQHARDVHQFVLFVDEVQTGMFRTGPFLRALDIGIQPDIVTIGKGTSDTFFPFALTLYNDRVHEQLDRLNPELPAWLHHRHRSGPAYAALLNSLRRADREDWTGQVRQQATLFAKQLQAETKGCRNVVDVRVFGMLIGIELNSKRWPARLFGKQLAKLYSLAMLNHAQHPLLMGFCQYEPHVFKLTPGLVMQEQHIANVCRTIGETLHRSPMSVAAEGLKTILSQRRS